MASMVVILNYVLWLKCIVDRLKFGHLIQEWVHVFYLTISDVILKAYLYESRIFVVVIMIQ